MAHDPVTHVRGTAVHVPGNDIDTDRIIPARFLKCVTFDDLAEGLFHDERWNEDGSSKGHVLDAPEHKGASIILTGDNFGCGSSREHAPQSLKRAGYVGVIAGSFAEIFFGNATTLGMVCASMGEQGRATLAAIIEADPATQVDIDVERLVITAAGQEFPFTMRETAHEALLSGYWDPLAELMTALPEARAKAAAFGYATD